jgi:hypothetical protein
MMDRRRSAPRPDEPLDEPRKDDENSQVAAPGARDDDLEGEEYEGLGVS